MEQIGQTTSWESVHHHCICRIVAYSSGGINGCDFRRAALTSLVSVQEGGVLLGISGPEDDFPETDPLQQAITRSIHLHVDGQCGVFNRMHRVN